MCYDVRDVETMWKLTAARIEATNELNAKKAAASPTEPPENTLAFMLRKDLGVTVNPQALRLFTLARWPRASKLAHEIHESA